MTAEVQTSQRRLPQITDANRDFWTAGADGVLRIARCQACGFWIHPPAPVCAKCYGREIRPEAVQGRGVVAACTVNHQPWSPTLQVPYALAIVELHEQQALRLTTQVVDCPPDEVKIGMPVEVVFEAVEDVHIPLFRPSA